MKPHSLVANAADEQQVRHAERKVKTRRNEELNDLRFVLDSQQGRRLLWRLISHCGVFQSPSNSRSDLTQQNIGRGDVGRFILGEIIEADENQYLLMQREARGMEKREVEEIEASRIVTGMETESDE